MKNQSIWKISAHWIVALGLAVPLVLASEAFAKPRKHHAEKKKAHKKAHAHKEKKKHKRHAQNDSDLSGIAKRQRSRMEAKRPKGSVDMTPAPRAAAPHKLQPRAQLQAEMNRTPAWKDLSKRRSIKNRRILYTDSDAKQMLGDTNSIEQMSMKPVTPEMQAKIEENEREAEAQREEAARARAAAEAESDISFSSLNN